ncbi:MAG: DedA family protein [Pseudohongiella sp.]|uniref:DedA family protein n=1 Tax=Pseudohongiella sp. TaxID=1979412 RepID=UPI0034A0381D
MQIIQDTMPTLSAALSSYPYLAIFVGLLLMGEMVLLPAIYMAVTGRIDLAAVIILAVLATLISDYLWYALSRRFPSAMLKRKSGHVSGEFLARLEQAFNARAGRVLFLSKFVYGTRTLVQVLAGIHGMPFRIYSLVNTAGVLAVTASLVLLAYAIIGSTYRLNEIVEQIEIAFLVFVIAAVAGYILLGIKVKQQWYP